MQSMSKKFAALVMLPTLVLSWLAPGISSATTLQRMSISDLSHAATLIVRARCTGNFTRWETGEIWTLTSFEVQETWKGSPPAQVTVRLLGGRFGNLTSSVSGVPRFVAGEEVVLFLERTVAGDLSIVSWIQGTFRIARDRATGSDTITQDTAASEILDPSPTSRQQSAIRRMPAGEFRSLVAAALDAAPRRVQ